jgi:hypothetical protein
MELEPLNPDESNVLDTDNQCTSVMLMGVEDGDLALDVASYDIFTPTGTSLPNINGRGNDIGDDRSNALRTSLQSVLSLFTRSGSNSWKYAPKADPNEILSAASSCLLGFSSAKGVLQSQSFHTQMLQKNSDSDSTAKNGDS